MISQYGHDKALNLCKVLAMLLFKFTINLQERIVVEARDYSSMSIMQSATSSA